MNQKNHSSDSIKAEYKDSEQTARYTRSGTCTPLKAGWFTGTLDIIRLSEQAMLDDPEFRLDEGFKVVLWRP